mmetsp:Transcript_40875/g.94154  ORF Transcript_40875/g.94154 Transcript_40875/m.94154 type:complete len:109 (+) Transcript_40875:51-377(+)
MLIELAAAEDGENWIGERYKRGFDKPFVPDWQLPMGWVDPDTPRGKSGCWRLGLLECTYITCPLGPMETPAGRHLMRLEQRKRSCLSGRKVEDLCLKRMAWDGTELLR